MTRFDEAVAAHHAGDFDAAVAAYKQRLAEAPEDNRAAENMIAALHQAGRSQEAIEFGKEAAKRFPRSADLVNNVAMVFARLEDHARASALFERALQRDPSSAQIWVNLGFSRVREGLPGEAALAYEEALKRDPANVEARVQLVHQSQQVLAWDRLDRHIAELRRLIAAGDGGIDPWSLISVCRDPQEILRCAAAISRKIQKKTASEPPGKAFLEKPRPPLDRTPGRRIRLGYFSADFKDHPTSYLVLQMIEKHDKERFELFGYAIDNPNDRPIRQRAKAAFEQFRELGGLTAAEAAGKIVEDRVDILIDLMGFTRGARVDVLSLKPAPIQICFLGFPGSTGSRVTDYIIADRNVVPPGSERDFTEKPIRMPLCYQVNDGGRPPVQRPQGAARAQALRALGAPEDALLFSNFNQFYKLTPDILAAWIEILHAVPRALLWIVAYNDKGVENFRRMIGAGGIASERLLISPIANQPEHLQRSGLADIMLDTHPCGGHTIASDALRAGCPIVTMEGQTFASRVGASLARTLGFPELIAQDLTSYKKMAIDLARDREGLSDLQQRIWQAAQSHPMFDGDRFAQDLERGLEAIWERHLAGEAPQAIDL